MTATPYPFHVGNACDCPACAPTPAARAEARRRAAEFRGATRPLDRMLDAVPEVPAPRRDRMIGAAPMNRGGFPDGV